MATGWLGWLPSVALTTPIPQIEMALSGAIDWHNRKMGGSKKEEPAKKTKSDPAKAASALVSFFRSRKKAE